MVWTIPNSVYNKCGERTVYEAVKSIDNNIRSHWRHHVKETHWIIYNFTKTMKIKQVGTYWYNNYGDNINVYVSDDPANWGTAVVTGWNAGKTAEWKYSPIFDKNGRYVKLEIVSTTHSANYIYSLSEFVADVYKLEGNLQITALDYTKSAHLNETVNVWGTVTNQGGEDDCLIKLVDIDTVELINSWSGFLSAGATYNFSLAGTMPNKAWKLELRAGHIE